MPTTEELCAQIPGPFPPGVENPQAGRSAPASATSDAAGSIAGRLAEFVVSNSRRSR